MQTGALQFCPSARIEEMTRKSDWISGRAASIPKFQLVSVA